jgi:glutathione synthase/RimK-type ligase-like ATP-grasp enzyme
VRFFVYPYQQGSKSAKALADALSGRVLKREGSKYVPRQGDIVVNWGDSACPRPGVLNSPVALGAISNKRIAFQKFKEAGIPIPRFALTATDANWKGQTVVRHKLTGHSGEGIELVPEGGTLPTAPLYVEYIKKEQEYRVHVGGKSIIAVQRKARRKDIPDSEVNWQVRNHSNGFVFVREGFTAPQCVLDAAIDALGCSGLDFGAVDVILNAKEGKAYVLEINTAPGLEGQTITDYSNYFKSLASL